MSPRSSFSTKSRSARRKSPRTCTAAARCSGSWSTAPSRSFKAFVSGCWAASRGSQGTPTATTWCGTCSSTAPRRTSGASSRSSGVASWTLPNTSPRASCSRSALRSRPRVSMRGSWRTRGRPWCTTSWRAGAMPARRCSRSCWTGLATTSFSASSSAAAVGSASCFCGGSSRWSRGCDVRPTASTSSQRCSASSGSHEGVTACGEGAWSSVRGLRCAPPQALGTVHRAAPRAP
mmetsp:Transcript_53389/g.165213  ORF Transcript_53389/g.165213 Transcript_53389/m.165213 type:complete len:234 (-) Transcript_53389:88-789(-)